MARAQVLDFLQSFRFFVNVMPAPPGTGPNLQTISNADGGNGPQAGFSTVSVPEANTESVEYREGQYVYTRKEPGYPTISDITLQRGVTRGDSSFWDWLRVVIEGSGEYRADMDILHYHRDTALTRPYPTTGAQPNLTQINVSQVLPARIYHVFEAFPMRHKVAADLDATAAEISIMDLDVSYEHFEVEEVAAP
jgi:phage tail-like protein